MTAEKKTMGDSAMRKYGSAGQSLLAAPAEDEEADMTPEERHADNQQNWDATAEEEHMSWNGSVSTR
mgnify:CR=1 FL=1